MTTGNVRISVFQSTSQVVHDVAAINHEKTSFVDHACSSILPTSPACQDADPVHVGRSRGGHCTQPAISPAAGLSCMQCDVLNCLPSVHLVAKLSQLRQYQLRSCSSAANSNEESLPLIRFVRTRIVQDIHFLIPSCLASVTDHDLAFDNFVTVGTSTATTCLMNSRAVQLWVAF